MTKLQIINKALRILGDLKITQSDLDNDSNEQARIVNDIYDSIRDEVLISHPWNFALKRANLTELGGEITTWTASGTANVWQATLDLEAAPAFVKFNGTEGTEQTSVVACNAENYWYWASDVLYVYSTSDPDTAYTSPGIEAVIPEFEYDHAYSLPSDCLRVVRMEDDDAEFVKEGSLLLTNETEAKILYIAQITAEASFSPAFIMAFAQRLASEMTIPSTNDPNLAISAFNLYKEKRRQATAIDAQEGITKRLEVSDWQNKRK